MHLDLSPGLRLSRGVVAQLARDGGCGYNGEWHTTHTSSDTVFVTGPIIIRGMVNFSQMWLIGRVERTASSLINQWIIAR